MSATPTTLTGELESAHRQGVTAAGHGMQDPALGALRLTGSGVPVLAEAAVSSATPFLRAPLLSRIFKALRIHPVDGDDRGHCPTCRVPAPCQTAQELNP
ncbi:MAG TPA: hypothetical protein VGB75_10390 [Jatrophihabitans sp.]|jgi:hypothetical protein|uniref:hypothetical protein n=1 Tax=Jatrophihabitans sp. TaxID=1932789 RepID=UPI002EEB656D